MMLYLTHTLIGPSLSNTSLVAGIKNETGKRASSALTSSLVIEYNIRPDFPHELNFRLRASGRDDFEAILLRQLYHEPGWMKLDRVVEHLSKLLRSNGTSPSCNKGDFPLKDIIVFLSP
jgi:hypothetical protein